MKPTFIIGGTVASGTSFLSSVLLQHPEVFIHQPLRPEPNFFQKSWVYERGLEYWERTWFSGATSKHKAVGERSSLYLSDFSGKGVVARRIRDAVPAVKLVFMLRDPVERAWANYRFTALSGLEWLSFEDALAQEDARMAKAEGIWKEIQPHAYFRRGLYAEQLRPYFELFPREQLLILSSDQVRKEPDAFLRRLFRFIGVDENVKADGGVYTSPNVRSLRVQRWLRRWNPGRLDLAVEQAREAGHRDLFARVVGWNLTDRKQPIPQETAARLRERYRPHIQELAKLVDLPVTQWLTNT